MAAEVIAGRASGTLSADVHGPAARSAVRQDVQALRGLAVLAVLLYHAKVLPVRGGFLGVDIFFVISGFLITKNILTDLDRGRFSFLDFYSRRARRLLPAAYCTLIVTALLASRTLTQDRWSGFVAQLLGALTFSANFVLPMQSGYFATAAETKPLLHIWSLAVEEQYYFGAPLLLLVLPLRWRLRSLLTLTLASLALCAVLASVQIGYWRLPWLDSHQFAFFMLPPRAWEMGAGSLLAGLTVARIPLHVPRAVKWLTLALLCGLCMSPLDEVHPRGDALAGVLLTVLLIAGGGGWIGNSTPVRALARVGDWSYSLYLVHWPLFALATCAFLGHVPTELRVALIALSLLLAWLQYRFVEQRFRHGGRLQTSQLVRLLALSAAVALLPFVLGSLRPGSKPDAFAYLHQPNKGLSDRCAAAAAVSDPTLCSTAPQPRVALWGDSFAMHLVPGLREITPVGLSLLQVTKAACAPVRGTASIDSNYDATWARGCLEFNERAFELIAGMPSVRYVLLSSPFSGYLEYGPLKLFDAGQSKTGDRNLVLERLAATVRALQQRGKIPIVIAPPPRPGFDIGACREQLGSGLVILGRSNCDFPIAARERHEAGTVEGLRQLRTLTGVAVVWLDGPICRDGQCRTAMPDGRSIYSDGGHLTIPGSAWLVPQVGIERLLAEAR